MQITPNLPVKSITLLSMAFLFCSACASLSASETEENKLKATLSTDMNDQEARIEYARLLRNLKKYDESLTQYQKLLAETPNDKNLKIEMAEVLYYQGNHTEALTAVEGISLNDINDKSRLLMAEIYRAGKNYPKAESIYKIYLEKNPADNKVKLKLAEQLSWEKRYDESVGLYRQILAENPSDIQLRRKYALVLMWMGNENEAAEELKSTLNDQ